MFTIDVQLETQNITRLANGFTQREIAIATSRGINKALRLTRTQIKREITTAYLLPASQVSENSLKARFANQSKLYGEILGDAAPESLAHFPLSAYKGDGVVSTRKRKKDYLVKRGKGRGDRANAGIFVEIVRGRKEQLKTAFLIFNNGKPLVMARGAYKGPAGFEFAKPRLPITKLNTKSIYWASLHPKAISIWSPFTLNVYIAEVKRQLEDVIPLGI